MPSVVLNLRVRIAIFRPFSSTRVFVSVCCRFGACKNRCSKTKQNKNSGILASLRRPVRCSFHVPDFIFFDFFFFFPENENKIHQRRVPRGTAARRTRRFPRGRRRRLQRQWRFPPTAARRQPRRAHPQGEEDAAPSANPTSLARLFLVAGSPILWPILWVQTDSEFRENCCIGGGIDALFSGKG